MHSVRAHRLKLSTRWNVAERSLRNQFFRQIAVAVAFAIVVLAVEPSNAQMTIPTDYRNYAMIGGATIILDPYSSVLGDVYAAGDISVNNGYGIQVPAALVGGNFYTRGNFNLNSGFTTTANVAANGNFVGLSGTLAGNVQYGGDAGGIITGTKTHVANSVPLVAMPAERTFTPGTQNISTSTDLVLQPGSYGNVAFTGQYDSLTLSSGDYFLNSLNGNGVGDLRLNITNGPIRIYSAGDISFANNLSVYINGVKLSTTASSIQAEGAMASNVLFQSGGNIRVTGYIGSFAGTLFAPHGDVTLDTQNWYGSVIAGGGIHSEGYLIKESFNFANAAMAKVATPDTTVIVGGSKSVTTTVANLAAQGGGNLNFTATTQLASGGATIGSLQPSSDVVQPGNSTSLSFSVTGTQVGQARINVNVNDPNAFSPTTTSVALINVLDHAAPSVSASVVRAMRGSTASSSVIVTNTSASYRAGLQITDSGGMLDLTNGTIVPNGSSVGGRIPLDTSNFGPTSASVTLKLSDDPSLPGAIVLTDKQLTVSGSILDNRRVTVANAVDLGLVHTGASATGTATLSTTGADNFFTRITVNNATADTNGIAVTGTNTFRFGLDGMSSTRTVSGTPNKLGVVNGSFSLTTNAEANVAGTQTLANVPISYSVKVYSGQATWNLASDGVWATHANWTDNLSNAGAGAPGVVIAYLTDTATFGNITGNAATSVALNGTSPTIAQLRFENNLGGAYTIAQGTSGSLTVKAPSGGTAVVNTSGNNRITAPLAFTGGNIVAVNGAQNTLTIDGALTSSSGVAKTGPGTLAINSSSNNLASITISEGAVQGSVASLSAPITNNATLIFNQPTDANFTGTITGTGGIVKTGAGRLSFSGINNFNANAPLTVSGGSLVLPIGLPVVGAAIQLNAGGTLEVANSVPRTISGAGTVLATGDLTLGRSSQPAQLNLGGAPGVGGTLNVGGNAVVVLSSDAAILGSLTSLAAGGSLTALNGARLGPSASVDATKILTATGAATVNANFINNGLVNGPTQAGQQLTFTQAVSGAGSMTGNIAFAGSYSPGNSPAAVQLTGNATLNATSQLKLEIGGLNAGSLFDQLNVGGQLSLAGTMSVSLINGFSPDAGQTFDVLNFGSLSGAFSGLQLPAITGKALTWDTTSLYTAGSLSVVPTYLRGDLNRDGQATTADISALLRALTNLDSYAAENSLTSAQLNSLADFDQSGSITNADIQGLLGYLATLGADATAAVPEPSSVGLFLLGVSAVFLRRRRKSI